jgi:1,4-alpha-glucan branching enzyme
MSGQHKKDVGAVVRKDGVSFRVWAPFANAVAVSGSFNDWQLHPMESEGDGYWATTVPGARAGQEYRYAITNGDQHFLRNDPRALQVTTVAGNSVVVDPHFEWTDQEFKPVDFDKQVIYEMHVGTFYRPDLSTIGTFEDVIAKLDYLVKLGVTTIELMPISTMSPEREWWGYTPMFIYTVESQYGGRYRFLEFVNAAHEKGVSVILDVVYNHFGPSGLDMWQFDGWQEDGKGGIYFYNDWRGGTPWGDTRPDYGRPEVRDYILDNVRMWMYDCHVDGLRVDSTIFIRNATGNNDRPDTDLADGWRLLQQVNEVAHKLNPGTFTVGEDVGANHYITKPVSEGGAGFSAQWEVSFPQALREALASSDPGRINLAGLLGQLSRRYNDDVMQRVIYIDSHDSAANGSARLNEVLSPGKSTDLFARQQLLLAAALLLTAPGIPMLLQGEEFMMNGNFNDWEGLDWRNADVYAGIVKAYRDLIALRRNMSGLSAGLSGRSMNLFHVNENDKVIAYHRWQNGGVKDDVVVVVNFGNRSFTNYTVGFPQNGRWRLRFCSSDKKYSEDFPGIHVPDVEVHAGNGAFLLPASTALIFSQS